MKYLKIILLLLVITTSSCDKYLDIEPTDILIEESVFKDASTAEAALSDAYNKLFISSTGNFFKISEVSTNATEVSPGSSYTVFFGGNLTSDNSSVENLWASIYETINISNVLIDKIPIYGTYHESIMKQHIAEARFCRAYSYWELLIYFSDGGLTGKESNLCVPLRLKPYDGFTEADLIGRNTNKEVYDFIISELLEAIIDLPEAYDDDVENKARATKNSAYAMLSRVELYRRNYSKSIEYSDKVLNSGFYQLESNLLDLFPNNPDGTSSRFGKEIIFGFPVGGNKGNFQFGTHQIFYYDKFTWVSKNFIDMMSDNDKRKTELIFIGNPLITNPITKNELTTFKFNNPDQRDDIYVIRLAEILLNKSEALAHNGVNQESIDLINSLRERAGINLYNINDFTSKDDLLNAIFLEREIETAFEGRGRFDLLRTGRPLRNIDLDDYQKILPIPRRDVDISNGTLIQNPGY